MIAKNHRLTEREVKKALQRGKPFFSHGFVFNRFSNTCNHNRFAIVIGGKSVTTAVSRNFHRRLFYNLVQPLIGSQGGKGFDIVCVVKKQTKLDINDKKSVANFEKDIHFLLSKVFK